MKCYHVLLRAPVAKGRSEEHPSKRAAVEVGKVVPHTSQRTSVSDPEPRPYHSGNVHACNDKSTNAYAGVADYEHESGSGRCSGRDVAAAQMGAAVRVVVGVVGVGGGAVPVIRDAM